MQRNLIRDEKLFECSGRNTRNSSDGRTDGRSRHSALETRPLASKLKGANELDFFVVKWTKSLFVGHEVEEDTSRGSVHAAAFVHYIHRMFLTRITETSWKRGSEPLNHVSSARRGSQCKITQDVYTCRLIKGKAGQWVSNKPRIFLLDSKRKRRRHVRSRLTKVLLWHVSMSGCSAVSITWRIQDILHGWAGIFIT